MLIKFLLHAFLNMKQSKLSHVSEHLSRMEEDPEKVKEEIVMLEHMAEEELKPISEKSHLKPW